MLRLYLRERGTDYLTDSWFPHVPQMKASCHRLSTALTWTETRHWEAPLMMMTMMAPLA